MREAADSSQSLGKAEKLGQWLYKEKQGGRGQTDRERGRERSQSETHTHAHTHALLQNRILIFATQSLVNFTVGLRVPVLQH